MKFDPSSLSYEALWTIVVGITCNVACAILGCYLVLRRISLLGDAISHAVLPGIAVAFLLAGRAPLPLFLGAMAMGLLTTFLTQALSGMGKVPEDASMGVVFTSLFAIGVILITNLASRIDLDPGCVLYGLIEYVPLDTIDVLGWEVPRAMQALSLALATTVLLVVLFWKEFKIVAFDPQLAGTMGINAMLFHYLLMSMVAGVTVASFEAVGSILVIAMLIVPAAAAHLLTDRLGWMMVWAVTIGTLSAVLGYAGDRYWQTGVAPMMAVMAGAMFGLAVLFAPRHGIVSKSLHNLSLATRIMREDIVALLYRREEAGAADPTLTIGQALQAAGSSYWRWLAIPELWRLGQVSFESGWRLQLTGQGRLAAQSLVRSHRLWETYLDENFQLPLDHLHAAAERVEHFIGPDLQQQLAAEVRTADRDPHGKAIPPVASP